MNKLLLPFLLIVISFTTFTQEKLITDTLWNIQMEGISAFDIDEQGNCILANKNALYKYNDQGKLIFQESQKSIGTIETIDARNPMKISLFSSEQQLLQYCDNTLTFLNAKVLLDDYNIHTATAFSGSNQNNSCWVYDQSNSKLILLSIYSQHPQIIENLKGLLGFKELSKIIESNNFLYLIDYKTGVYKLNIFGTLIAFYPIQNIENISIDHEDIYFTREKSLLIFDFKTDEVKKIIDLNFEPVGFKKTGNFFYFLSPSKLSKLSFHN